MYEKSLEMKHFRVCPYREEAELAPSWAARVGRDEKKGLPRRRLDVQLMLARMAKPKLWLM